MKKKSREWIEAAKVLSANPRARVLCPSCEKDYLRVKDVSYPDDPELFDRYLTCLHCGAGEVLSRLRRADAKSGPE
jgi:hypothetical protein